MVSEGRLTPHSIASNGLRHHATKTPHPSEPQKTKTTTLSLFSTLQHHASPACGWRVSQRTPLTRQVSSTQLASARSASRRVSSRWQHVPRWLRGRTVCLNNVSSTCSQECGRAFLPFYSQCEARIVADPRSAPMTSFRQVCQDAAAGGGGH